jgi:HEAT repeat protein
MTRPFGPVVVGLAGIAAMCGGAAEPQEAAPPPSLPAPPSLHVAIDGDGLVTLVACDARLEDVLAEIGRRASLVIMANEPLERRMTIAIERLTVPAALKQILGDRSFILRYAAPRHGSGAAAGNRLWVFSQRTAQAPVAASAPQAAPPPLFPEAAGDASDPLARIDAASLAAAGDTGRLAAELTTLALADPDPSTREEAVHALGALRDAGVAAVLEHALLDAEPRVREAAVAALARVGTERAARALATALNDPDSAVREEAVYALLDIGGDAAARLLRRAALDPAPAVRESAAAALAER